jgi:putative acetyltransferase
MTIPEIVAYELCDQPGIETFFRAVWHGSRFPFDPETAHSDLRRIQIEYQMHGGGFWLMRISEHIVGTVAVRRLSQDVAEIKRLNVDQQHRGVGFGDRLLRHALAHSAQTGYRAVRLDTIRNQGPAVHLFEKYGFVEIPRYNDNPDANLFMELDLRMMRATGRSDR